MIPRFPVYLFDVDGTLLDSAADICGAVQEVLSRPAVAELRRRAGEVFAPAGAAASPAPRPMPAGTDPDALSFEFLRGYIGRHLYDLFEDVIPGIRREDMDALLAEYRRNYLGRGHASTRLYPGVKEALAALPGRKSTATTKSTQTTRAVLEKFGLIGYFDHVQGTDGFPSKPAPDVIFKSLDALGVKAEDCLLVGDSAADMEAGRKAGVRTCAVRYGYGDPDEMALWTPDFWIRDLRELLK